MIIPDGQEAVRQMRVSQLLARGVFGGIASLVVLLFFFATGFFVKESSSFRAERLEQAVDYRRRQDHGEAGDEEHRRRRPWRPHAHRQQQGDGEGEHGYG